MGHSPESQSSPPIELTSGVDALYMSGRGTIPSALLDDLERLKDTAAEAGAPLDVHLAGYPFRVLGSGWGKYRYCAVHEVARVGFTPSDALPCVRVQPTSLGLHALGPDVLVLWVRNLLDALGIDATLQVARLDLHADFHGLDIAAEERSHFVGYSNWRALYEVDDALSGLNFGSRGGALYARIYDKTRELDGKGDDWWHDIWGLRYDPDRPVIRVEFEFSRTGLREFDIDTPEDAFAQLGALWAYATGTPGSAPHVHGDVVESASPDRRRHPLTLAGRSPLASHPTRHARRELTPCRTHQSRTERRIPPQADAATRRLPHQRRGPSRHRRPRRNHRRARTAPRPLRRHDWRHLRGAGRQEATAAVSTPDYDRVASVIAGILTRMVLCQPDPDEEGNDADDRLRASVDRRPGGPLP